MPKETLTKQQVLERIALSSLSLTSKDKGSLEPGRYDVSGTMTFQINGQVNVGKPYEQKIVSKVPWTELAMALMSRLSGCRIEEILDGLNDLDDKDLEEFSERVQDYYESITESTKKVCNGKITKSVGINSDSNIEITFSEHKGE